LRRPRSGLWAHHDFLKLWAGQTTSIFGTLIGGLALTFTAVIWLDAGPAEVAILSLCQTVPPFVIGPFAGVWVDRVRRRPLMVAADIGRAAALATVPAAALFDVLRIEQLYAVTAVTSSLSVFFAVAYEAHLPALVGRHHLVEGNSKMAASASAVEIGSFGIAGWLVQLLTGPGAMAINAVSFVTSALFLRQIRTPEPPPRPVDEREHVLREALDGARAVRANGLLVTLLLAAIVLEFGSRPVSVLYAVYLVNDVGFNPGVLGMIFAVGGAMSLVGAWVASRTPVVRRLGWALPVSVFIRAAGMLCMPLAASVSPIGFFFLVANQLITDPAWMFYEIHEVSLRQRVTRDEFLGRVNATMRFAGFGAAFAGTGLAAAIGEMAGARAGLFTAAGVTASAGLLLVLSPALRRHLPRRPLAEAR
jgi:hypothetical protein